MFVIENKLLLSYRSVKSMHYPELPKVSVEKCKYTDEDKEKKGRKEEWKRERKEKRKKERLE